MKKTGKIYATYDLENCIFNKYQKTKQLYLLAFVLLYYPIPISARIFKTKTLAEALKLQSTKRHQNGSWVQGKENGQRNITLL